VVAEHASDALVEMPKPPRTRALSVLVHPWATNDYQPLLYEAVLQADPSVRLHRSNWQPLDLALLLPRMLYYRLTGTSVFHLHWPIFTPRPHRSALRTIALYYCLSIIWLIKLLRFRLIWTMHNRLPHEAQTADDVRVARTILAKSDAVIVHSPATAADIASQLKPTTLLFTAAQGPYPTVLASHTPSEIREDHAIPPDAVLFLFCGWIREYKGIPELLHAFRELADKAQVHLIIAGECDNPELHHTILDAARSISCLTYLPGYLPDPKLSSYLRAADYVCLPFRRLTTSSSAMLALSHLRPIIAPMLGDLVDLPPACGYFYDPVISDGLPKALVAAANAGPPQDCRTGAIASFIRASSWAQLAEVTLSAYRRSSGSEGKKRPVV